MAYPSDGASILKPPIFRSVAQASNEGVFQASMQIPMQPSSVEPYSESDGTRYYLVKLYLDGVEVSDELVAEGARSIQTFEYISVSDALLGARVFGASSSSSIRYHSQFVSFRPSGYVIHMNGCGSILMSNCRVDGISNGIMASSSGVSLSEVEMTLMPGYGSFILNRDSDIIEYNVKKSVVE